MFYQRIVLNASDRVAGSTYGSPTYNTISLPAQMNKAEFYKVFIVEANISCEIPNGGDESHIHINIVNKQPINQIKATGTGSRGDYLLATLPYYLKEQSNAILYTKLTPAICKDYLLFSQHDFQNTGIQLNITEGKDISTITEPQSGLYNAWTIVLGIEPITREQLASHTQ